MQNIDTIDEMIAVLLFFVTVICLFISIPAFIKNHKNKKHLRAVIIFFILVSLQLVIGFIGQFFLKQKFSNKSNLANISLAIYIIPEFIIFSILLKEFIRSIFIKKYLTASIFIYPIIVLLCWFLIEGWIEFFSVISTIGSILIIFPCLYYFFELLRNPPILNLADEPAFWIVTGILFLFLIITPFYLAYKIIYIVPELVIIDYIAYFLTILLFTKAILCKSSQRTLP